MKARRRRGWLWALALVTLAVVAADIALLARQRRYRDETERLRAGMSEVERKRADAILARDRNRDAVIFELLRKQALGDPDLHLSVLLDSSVMYLERSNAILRRIPIVVGRDAAVDSTDDGRRMTVPTGTRSVERIIGNSESYELPLWVWEQRQLPVPDDRGDPRFLGSGAIVLTGGTLIYARPDDGPLADEWVMPGTVRISADDFRAVIPNLERGTKVYLF